MFPPSKNSKILKLYKLFKSLARKVMPNLKWTELNRPEEKCPTCIILNVIWKKYFLDWPSQWYQESLLSHRYYLFTFILNYVLASEIPSNEYCIINMELVISLSITYRLLQSQHNTWNHRINVPAGYKDFMEIQAIRRRAVTVCWHQQIKYCLTREATRVCN